MNEMAKAIPQGRQNMIALGIAGRLLGFTVAQTFAPIEKRLADKGPAAIAASLAEQYEVVQRWVNGGNSTGVFSGHPDLIAGTYPAKRTPTRSCSMTCPRATWRVAAVRWRDWATPAMV